jgi:iron(III) transport system permease protein
MAISNALSKTDNSLEDAAVITGAHRFKAIMTITIPMITPAIFSIGLFVFSRSMANFGATALLLPPTEETMTTRIYSSLSQLDMNTVAVMSIILVLFSGLVFLFQNIWLRKKKYTIESSQTSSPRLTKLKKWKKPIAILVILFQVLTTIFPVLVLFVSSFLKRWGLDLKLKNLTFQNYIDVFTNNTSLRAFRNSILYGLIAASISIVIGVTISYISSRTKFRGRKLIEFTASLPMSFPNTVMAISAIFAWNTVFFNIYNTAWIIIITYVVLFLPLVLKNITGLMQNQDFSTEGAARIAGASRLNSFKDILLPAIIPGIKSAFIVCMLIALKEIPISLMLHTKGTETVGVLLFNLRSNSKSYESTSTIAIIVIVISIVGRYFIEKDRKKKGVVNYEETGTSN